MKTFMAATAVLVLLVAGCGGAEQTTASVSRSPAPPSDSPAATSTAAPSTSAVDLPDNPGPSRAPDPGGSRRQPGRLVVVWIHEDGNGLDLVHIKFQPPTPRCTVRRVLDIPTGTASVKGEAFLIVRCAVVTGPWEPATVLDQARNVTGVVLTREHRRVLVVTLGLRHSAGWAVDAMWVWGVGGPIIQVEQ